MSSSSSSSADHEVLPHESRSTVLPTAVVCVPEGTNAGHRSGAGPGQLATDEQQVSSAAVASQLKLPLLEMDDADEASSASSSSRTVAARSPSSLQAAAAPLFWIRPTALWQQIKTTTRQRLLLARHQACRARVKMERRSGRPVI
jgi:hypothetical protein